MFQAGNIAGQALYAALTTGEAKQDVPKTRHEHSKSHHSNVDRTGQFFIPFIRGRTHHVIRRVIHLRASDDKKASLLTKLDISKTAMSTLVAGNRQLGETYNQRLDQRPDV
jgi:hypothetical protein